MALTKADKAWIRSEMLNAISGTDPAIPTPKAKEEVSAKVLPGRWAVTKRGHKERVPSPKAKVGARHFGVRTDKEGAKGHFWTVREGPRGLFYGDPSDV